MTTPTPKQSKTKVFKAPKVKRAPKSSKELAEVMDRQIAEHAADYKKLAR